MEIKAKFLFVVLVLLFPPSLAGQLIDEFDDIIADSSIISKESHFKFSGKDTFRLVNLIEIDRTDKIIRKTYFGPDTYGNSLEVMRYNDSWKAIEKISYSSDSSIFTRYRFDYNEKGQLAKIRTYSRQGFDKYENIHYLGETNYYYNSIGQKINQRGTRYVEGDTTNSYKTFGKLKYDKKGRLISKKSYSTQENPNKFKLTSTLKIKHSERDGFTVRKSIQKLKKRNWKMVYESFFNSDDQIIRSIYYRDGRADHFTEYKYFDNYLIESKHIDTNQESRSNFVAKYIYNKKR